MIEPKPADFGLQFISPTLTHRFWLGVKKTDSCWLWTKGVGGNGRGYTSLSFRPRTKISVHVLSWIIHNGPIPKGFHVLHNCPTKDNRLCVNPSHLYLGTNADNGIDRRLKHQALEGERNPQHKLDWKSVDVIRKSNLPQKELAKMFGVSKSVISVVSNFKGWNNPRP